jgi:hypothetical protein
MTIKYDYSIEERLDQIASMRETIDRHIALISADLKIKYQLNQDDIFMIGENMYRVVQTSDSKGRLYFYPEKIEVKQIKV